MPLELARSLRVPLAWLALAAPVMAADAPPAPDPDIARLVGEISTERLEHYVRSLAGFGTRHSLSAVDDPVPGIGAARRWIHETLQRCSDEAGGRLRVDLDEFVQEPTPRVPKPVTLVNSSPRSKVAIPEARRARSSCRDTTTRCAAT